LAGELTPPDGGSGSRIAVDVSERVEQSQALVAAVARRFSGRVPVEDLEQAGMVGVMLAARSFDPDRGVPFHGYAMPFITGEMLATVRGLSPTHVSRAARELARTVEAASDAATAALGRAPTVADIAHEAELDEEQVVEGLRARAALAPPVVDEAALDQPGVDQALEAAVARLELEPLLLRLDRRSRTILALRFGMELSQAEIAERLGMSQMHVSRLLRTALAELDRDR
jgi:RNA polymerase sigma-B factor